MTKILALLTLQVEAIKRVTNTPGVAIRAYDTLAPINEGTASIFFEMLASEAPRAGDVLTITVETQRTPAEAAQTVVTRLFCPDCKAEVRGVTEGGLPVQFLSGRFPHKGDCPGDGDIWTQLYAWKGDDTPPSFDETDAVPDSTPTE
jgi:hypothetical protein